MELAQHVWPADELIFKTLWGGNADKYVQLSFQRLQMTACKGRYNWIVLETPDDSADERAFGSCLALRHNIGKMFRRLSMTTGNNVDKPYSDVSGSFSALTDAKLL